MNVHITLLYCLVIASIVINFITRRISDRQNELHFNRMNDIVKLVNSLEEDQIHLISHTKDVLQAADETIKTAQEQNKTTSELLQALKNGGVDDGK